MDACDLGILSGQYYHYSVSGDEKVHAKYNERFDLKRIFMKSIG
jgi:hypothetical protein